MKTYLGIAVVALVVSVFLVNNNAEAVGPNDYYLVLHNPDNGHNINLAPKFAGYDSCANSTEFAVHSLNPNATIKCINELPTYR